MENITDLNLSKELYTIRDMIRWAASQFAAQPLFYGHGTDQAWDEACNLILLALHLDPTYFDMVVDAHLTSKEKLHLLALIEQRVKQRIPVPYLIKKARFADLDFYVDERVLIPRSPLAEVIEAGFIPWFQPEEIHTVLDLCTGSGCIALAVAAHLGEQVQVEGVDISADALEVAEINRQALGLQDQVHFIQSDLFEQLKGKRYDVIISNPPYVDQAEMLALPEEYKHEPTLALAAGEDGLSIVHKILKQAADHLTDHGILIVEVGASAAALIAAYPDLPFIWLEFERGGDGVFLLYKTDLMQKFNN